MKFSRNKKYFIILIFVCVALLSFWWGVKKAGDSKKREFSFHKKDDTIVYFIDVEDEPYLNYEFPQELAAWIGQSLLDGNWKEKLKEISIESRVLRADEKKYLSEQEEVESSIGLAVYCSDEPKLLKDKWHIVSLSEYGDDIVIESYDWDGAPAIYYFQNIFGSGMYSEVPMLLGEYNMGSPYFISWEGVHYMAVPVWDERGKELLGIEVHDFYTNLCNGVVTGIKTDGNGAWSIKSQDYLVVTPRFRISDDATLWPTVVTGDEQ